MTVLPLGRVTVRLDLGRLLLTAVAAVLYAAGWSTRKTLAAAWFAVSWCVAAVRVGWMEAGRRGAP